MRRVVKPVGKTGRRYLRASARTIVQNPCFVRTANYNFSPSHHARYYRHHRSDSLFNSNVATFRSDRYSKYYVQFIYIGEGKTNLDSRQNQRCKSTSLPTESPFLPSHGKPCKYIYMYRICSNGWQAK